MSIVAGLDGCRTGWVVARADTGASPGRRVVSVEVVGHVDEVLDDLTSGALALVAVDMPLGLPDSGPRACDREARALLGPRRSSVFPAPVRAVLGSCDHAEANARSRSVDGRGLSVQAWNLVPRIAELDDGWERRSPTARAAVFETHPELGFAVLGGAPMAHHKRTAAGRRERLRVLRPHVVDRWTRPAAVPAGAARDDVLDALVLAVRAAQWCTDGPPPIELGGDDVDARGRPMRIRG